MAWIPTFTYEHPNGWNDKVNFPTTPASEDDARALLQHQHTEALEFINQIGEKLNNIPSVKASGGGNIQTVANGSATKLTFPTEILDNNSIFDVSTDNTKFICKTAGIYIIVAYVYWGNESSLGYRDTLVLVNGATIADNLISLSGTFSANTITAIAPLNVNDYVQVQVGQSSGTDVTVSSRSFSMVRIA